MRRRFLICGELGQGFFLAVVGTELSLVLLAAPAATAGAICQDRARGTLLHMLMTDLSAAEIVLGKLAARLTPVLAMICCTLPMLELLSLLGGVDPLALGRLCGFSRAGGPGLLAGASLLAAGRQDARSALYAHIRSGSSG